MVPVAFDGCVLTLIELQDGSSGSWVVDEYTDEIYGHIVADDPCGDIFVVPFTDMLDDIKRAFSAKEVTLPTTIDVFSHISRNNSRTLRQAFSPAPELQATPGQLSSKHMLGESSPPPSPRDSLRPPSPKLLSSEGAISAHLHSLDILQPISLYQDMPSWRDAWPTPPESGYASFESTVSPPPPPPPELSNIYNPSGQPAPVGQVSHTMAPAYNSGYVAFGPHTVAQPQQVRELRPFKCDQCPQSFYCDHELKSHEKIHLALKPFSCKNCDKSFSRKDPLKVCFYHSSSLVPYANFTQRHMLVKGCRKS